MYVWMEISWKICFKRCAMFLKNIYICMDNSPTAWMENLFQRMHGKFVPKDAQCLKKYIYMYIWMDNSPSAWMENLFPRMHGKFVPKDVNIETHVWKILFWKMRKVFKFLDASLEHDCSKILVASKFLVEHMRIQSI